MKNKGVSRRQFMKSSTGVLMGTLAIAASPIALLAPSRVWALELSKLDTQTGQALLQLTRHIYPHATLDDAVYALVVKDLDNQASDNAELADMLTSGVGDLNEAAGGDWLGLSLDKQAGIVNKMAGSPLFQKVHGTATVSLYNNDMAFAHFGYQGPSAQEGGYLTRGFDDLTWLPNPSAEASPAPN